ncbi:hypothetical protein K7432_006973 [Basidiobolus ranarum]|uniref:Gfd2/YDR514C-like C-terminal domain-containing protein n=1 Tax=Basidiobolus ranarum TaxID=34480 RepID=A0ABR2W0T1_9FUNG
MSTEITHVDTIASSLYLLSSLEKFWAQALDKVPTLQNVVTDHLKAPDFYTNRIDRLFYLGISQKDSLRYLLLSEHSYLKVKEELELLLKQELPMFCPLEMYNEIEPVEVDSRATYYRVLKGLSKYNKVIKRQERERLIALSLGKAQRAISKREYMFIAIDIESYEEDHSYITEVGWTMYNSVDEVFLDKHYIIKENVHLRNGNYVADNKDRFIFGKSVCTTLLNTVADLEADWKSGYPAILVGHDVKNDLDYLRKMGANISEPIDVFDTTSLYMALTESHQKQKLSKILNGLGIEYNFLHNAGNDSHYTMEAFLAMTR